jgi:mono/diheme cytochrome c family protein
MFYNSNEARLLWYRLITGLVLVGMMLAACTSTNQPDNSPASIATLNLAGLPALITPTRLAMPVSIDDSRFPIAPATGDEWAAGQALYNQHCRQCHGVNGEGQQPDPYAYRAAPPHNNSGHTWHHPDQSNFEAVWFGRNLAGDMPGFSDKMTPDDVFKVLAYIKTWWSAENLAVQLERTRTYMENN